MNLQVQTFKDRNMFLCATVVLYYGTFQGTVLYD